MSYTTRIGPTFRRTKPYDRTFYECSTIMKQLDTPENLRPIILYDNTTGGQACAPLSNITYLDVVFASNSRLTDPVSPGLSTYPRRFFHSSCCQLLYGLDH